MPLPAALPAPGVPGGPRLAAVLGRAALEAATAGSTLDPGRGLRVVLIASLGTVIGAAAVLLPAARSPRALSASLGLGCGAMLWAALAEIVPEARAALGGQAGDPGHPPPSPYAVNLTVLAWFLLGVGLVVLLEALSERVLSNTEEATDPESNLAEIDEHGILRPASFADTTPSRVSSSTCAGDATSAQVARFVS
ncbi:hypothetical protein H696_03337 [Fonticula alba]|uniref:Uncharacterized protein n=1 Tax=Fonticula alba TaxID=691883 RepID=A0A058Z6W8_FONAL|nr:hypothetical protein H696_03337 [Fonticula alba]KCV69866.1 hypothetical protein H696_03337 [Fonticula alba]|eukprot:XP_009495472.1 hypothetical protein H696_03337 [Fonticula alba]